MTTAMWGVVLIIAALIAAGLQFRRWQQARITALQLAVGMVARGGFLFLGIIYATGLIYRWPRAPLIGLGIVGIGIVLNLVTGILDNIRRSRARYSTHDESEQ
jgi:Kef-type K+ transport system membrane component KefB